ncbi:carbamoyltransferase HypF [Pendulispora brunnea]|uniref:Carbamoyltransferase n=1 Tax=Pendulispora brunnea TaxID=2905690 RepID=A0ABZ2K4K0_9BACT
MTMRFGIRVSGTVQGVGFRPFVHRVARTLGLAGWVRNDGEGVRIEVEGAAPSLDAFVAALRSAAPPRAALEKLRVESLPPRSETSFLIVPSDLGVQVAATLPADLAPCAECLREMHDPDARRYRYPFTNCTACGPRYTIVRELPYDRARTTMRGFELCVSCEREYRDPDDRRFHAEPIACPRCGPELQALGPEGIPLAKGDAALRLGLRKLLDGNIVALKAVGGYQLLVLATNGAAVARLRERKKRPHKPFAVMAPSVDVWTSHAWISAGEQDALLSPEAPIVLVRRREPSTAITPIARDVAPGNPWLGAMLPSSPIHHLLLADVGAPVVCTSGNLSEEPICYDDVEAIERLRDVADVFLVHDRPIARPLDDSVVRVGPKGLEVLRRARGYAPRPLHRAPSPTTVLALGGHLKSSVALTRGSELVASQHIGDLDTPDARALLERTVRDLLAFFRERPDVIACDLHPDYASTELAERLAREYQAPLVRVQHHHAHVAACIADHELEGPVLGFAWDGTGYGFDGSTWGGEVLVWDGRRMKRVGSVRPFPLVGGDRAVRDPRRAALGIAWEIFGAQAYDVVGHLFSGVEWAVLSRIVSDRPPRTTSMGRLFDAMASLTGWIGPCSFEGQTAMDLEFAADGAGDVEAYPRPPRKEKMRPLLFDWEPVVRGIVEDGEPRHMQSARFHETVAQWARDVAHAVALPRVVLAGGCFQNQRLAARVRALLEQDGFLVYAPARIPTNDGGISVGQAWLASKRRAHVSRHSR